MPYNGWQLQEVGDFGAQNCQPNTHVIRCTKLQFTTEPPISCRCCYQLPFCPSEVLSCQVCTELLLCPRVLACTLFCFFLLGGVMAKKQM